MTNSPNILVVDDEEGIRVILEIGFQEIGANTILASIYTETGGCICFFVFCRSFAIYV